jgi:hypothetical protein
MGNFLSDLGVKMIMPEGQLLSSALCLNHWQEDVRNYTNSPSQHLVENDWHSPHPC